MTAEWMRKQLEELMGAEALGRVPENLTFEDPKVCRDFLCGLCPHDLFVNTKSEIGPCPRLHGEKYKTAYEEAKSSGKHPGFEPEHLRNLEQFISECDRRIASAQRRLEKTSSAEDPKIIELMKGLNDITDSISALTVDIEKLGEEGEIDEASKLMEEIERLKREKDEKERDLRAINKGSISQQQKLRVCEVCSAYLSVYDSDRRLADHFGGKMHLGYVQIREIIEKLKEQYPNALLASSASRGGGGYPPRGGGGGGGPPPYRDRRYDPYPPRGPPPRRDSRDYRDDRGGYDRGYGGGYERRRSRSPGRR
ncbi:LUC7-domain-containing protein [Hyaloraphidium curvatum]|nr:LUC7-domain-containing protein [Hyaloraphidium curvatum]